MKSLEPLANIVQSSFAGENPQTYRETYMIAWRAFAVSLFEYRRGNYTNALAWGKKCLAYDDVTPTRLAMGHLILALCPTPNFINPIRPSPNWPQPKI